MPIIDRRVNDRNKSLGNKNKYLKRVHDLVKDSVKRSAKNSNISDLLSKDSKKLVIPGKGLDKPSFNFKQGSGNLRNVFSGNDKYNVGDTIPKPKKGEGSGKEGGSGDDGESDLEFTLTKKQFFDIYFEDCELPDFVKKDAGDNYIEVYNRAGFIKEGTPNKLNIIKTMKQAAGRKFGLKMTFTNKLNNLIKRLNELSEIPEQELSEDQVLEISKLKIEIDNLNRKILQIPFLSETDLRFTHLEKTKQPITDAVLFAILDVSGSMGEWEMELAKSYFLILSLFIEMNYEDKLTIVFIEHTTIAKVVTEAEFFKGGRNGGTEISSALELVLKLIKEKYDPSKYNIFISQASDGDNTPSDNVISAKLLDKLLPMCEYYTYVELNESARGGVSTSNLYLLFDSIKAKYKNLKFAVVSDKSMVYSTFKSLFEKKK